jgi:3-keto-disaccharide hydrolase
VSTQPYETHGSLVLGPATTGDVTVQVDMATSRQLRTGSAPNPWEVGWLLWHYTDDQHFYYVILKPNGWEIGKEDPAYPGSQRFLASGSSPQFPLGPWYRVRVAQSAGTIQLFVNDLLIATTFDDDLPYSGGRVGLYAEDAESYFDNVAITTGAKGKKRR